MTQKVQNIINLKIMKIKKPKIVPGKINIARVIIILLVFTSCRKDEIVPSPTKDYLEMEYYDFANKEIKADAPGFSFDVNNDGRKDLNFATLLVGDPIAQVDKLQFIVSTNIGVCLPVNNNESIPCLNYGDSVLLDNFNGYQWFELSSIILMQKIISTNSYVWEGTWKDATHKFIPYQIKDSDKRYNGWVEISADISTQKIILHKAAISKTCNKIIFAGK